MTRRFVPSSRTHATLRVPGHERSLTLAGGAGEAALMARMEAFGGTYGRGVARVLQRLLAPDDVVVDAGAHIGIVALTLAVLVPDGTVHAMEAVPATAELLEHNVRANGITNVRVHRMALGSSCGTVRIAGCDGSSEGAHVSHRGQVEVPAVTLDEWVDLHAPRRLDLVKVDVEGSEFAVLAGARDTIERLRPTLVVAVNPAALRRVDGRGPRELWRSLALHYPLLHWVGRGGALLPMRGEDDLMAALRRYGHGDLVCAARPPRGGGWRHMAGRMWEAMPHRGPEHAVEPTLRVSPIGPVPQRMQARSRRLLPVEVHNGCGARLEASGHHPVVVAARWVHQDGRPASAPTRAPLPGPLRPGGTRRVAVEIRAPGPGEYRVTVALVHQGLAWLDDLGPEAALTFPVTVEPER